MLIDRIVLKRLHPGPARFQGQHVELSARLDESDDVDAALAQLEDTARRSLGEPTREQEAAAKVLDRADRPHHALRQLLQHAASEAHRAELHSGNAARHYEEAKEYAAQGNQAGYEERRRWGREEEATAATLDRAQPPCRAEALRLTEEIARVEADPAVILARTLLGRKPPAPWKASGSTTPAEEADEFDPSLPDGDDIPFEPTPGGAA
jgi:hypothetical protein